MATRTKLRDRRTNPRTRARALTGALALLLGMTLGQAACTDKNQAADASPKAVPEEAKGAVKAADFNLERMAEYIKEERVYSVEVLDEVLNDERGGINRVDLDGDDKVDRIIIHETRDEGTIVFALKAVPSDGGTEDDAVAVAKLGFTVQGDKAVGEAIFTDAVQHDDDDRAVFEYKVKMENGGLYSNHEFAAWVLAVNRPLYKSDFSAHFVAHKRPKKFKKSKRHKKHGK